MHAGFGAFRGAVLLHPLICAALRRHTRRASASVMAQGGFTPESGRMMQQLLDLQGLLTAVDVRDDHLAEERGGSFTQEALRDALLAPILAFWSRHARTWFGGVRLETEG